MLLSAFLWNPVLQLQLGPNRQVRIHPPCPAVHRFRKPDDGLRLPTQRLLQGIVWLLDPCRVSLELFSSVLSGFTNELFLWKTSARIEVPGRQNVHFASDDGDANGFRRPPKNPDAGRLLDLATRIARKLNH